MPQMQRIRSTAGDDYLGGGMSLKLYCGHVVIVERMTLWELSSSRLPNVWLCPQCPDPTPEPTDDFDAFRIASFGKA